MDPRQLCFDERLRVCAYCGGHDTADHVPSRVLLDEPYPPDLPVVGACRSCNVGFSRDEPYLACLIECALCGTTGGPELVREKVRRILAHDAALRRELDASREVLADGSISWSPNHSRVRGVILKLARGHAAWECAEPMLAQPCVIEIRPLTLLSSDARIAFEEPPTELVWPEIGSRAFHRAVGLGGSGFPDNIGWNVVQPGRYRYLLSHSKGIRVRIVLSEYLTAEIAWP